MVSPTVESPALKKSNVLLLFDLIAEDLARVEEILRSELQSDTPVVDQLLRHGHFMGGKRLRPALLLLAAKASGEIKEEHLLLAAVVEMIHTATLIHDDVLDEADTRRHQPTVNSRWDNSASVLLGDYLFTHAFYLASTVGSTLACRTIGRATNLVCEGELRQICSRGNYLLGEEEYFRIIEGKTAELCACSCELGAIYADADRTTVRRLSRYGRTLGMAFQIADDLLDVLGDETDAGKSLGTDLQQRKATLPLIHLMQQADPQTREQAINLLEQCENQSHVRAELSQLYARFDCINYTRTVAHRYAQMAREQLDELPDSKTVELLRSLTEFVVTRSH